MPKISVILPFYNAELSLSRAIMSVINQTFKDYELILIHNNGNDKSYEIASEFCRFDTRIRLISESKQGVSHAANAGICVAESKYIARTDADDVMLPNRLLLQYELFENEHFIDVCATQAEHIGSAVSGGIQAYVQMTNQWVSPHEIAANRFRELPVINPTLMFRRSVFEKFGMYEHSDLPEDYEFILRLLDGGGLIKKIPQKLQLWYDSPTRLTRTNMRYRTEAFWKVKAMYLQKYLHDNTLKSRPLWAWGAGKVSREVAQIFSRFNLVFQKYIDVDERKLKAPDVVHYSMVTDKNQCFVLAFVGNRGASEKIRNYLNDNGFTEGFDFLLCV